MYVDLRSSIGRAIYMKGEFDPHFFSALQRVLRRGDVFVDVGANVGYYTMLALDQIGPSGHVHAFEVDARPLRCLQWTARKRRLSNLTIHQVAVGDRTGTIRFRQAPESGHSHIDAESSVQVPITTLDEWRRECAAKVTAVKVDVEGAEILVLRGARQLIETDRPVWLCEALPTGQGDEAAASEFLRTYGYRIEPLRDVHTPAFVAWP